MLPKYGQGLGQYLPHALCWASQIWARPCKGGKFHGFISPEIYRLKNECVLYHEELLSKGPPARHTYIHK